MNYLLMPPKLIFFFLFTLSFIIIAIFIFPFLKLNPAGVRPVLIRIESLYARGWLKIFGIEMTVHGQKRHLNSAENYFIVANHMGYLDTFAVASLFPTCYVTSLEMKATPVVGQFTQIVGCLYVDRKNKKNLFKEIIEVKDALEHGVNVTVFPEALSTNGERIHRFRRPLYEAAIAAHKKVLPLTINYHEVNGEKISVENRDLVCWYGDDLPLVPHFFKMLLCRKIKMSVTIDEPLSSLHKTSQELSESTQAIITGRFRPFVHAQPQASLQGEFV